MAITSSPVQVGSEAFWAQVSANNYTTAGIKSDNSLWTWGVNSSGQLGLGDTNTQSSPTQVGTLTDWATVAVGNLTVISTKTDGTLWAMGSNDFGQLGTWGGGSQSSPVQVGTDSDWVQIAIEETFAAAIKTNGTLWTWGQPITGEGGDVMPGSTSPIQVGSDSDWAQVDCGDNFIVAIKTSNTMWAGGTNSFGQLGIPEISDSEELVQVGSLNNWSFVSCGCVHSVAVKTDGTLWAWGANDNGQLGIGNRVDKSSPVQVGSDTDWRTVSAGAPGKDDNPEAGITVAIKTDNSIWAWGYNEFGELGLGDTDDRDEPERVGTYNVWRSVDVSNYGKVIALSDNFVPPAPRVGVKSGKVDTFTKSNSTTTDYNKGRTVVPNGENTLEFGYATDVHGSTLVVGAPGSGYNTGYVYVYDNITYVGKQIITVANTTPLTDYLTSNVNPLPTTRYGTTTTLSPSEQWLYVGSPGEDTVYVYGKDESIPFEQTVAPLASQTILLTFLPHQTNMAEALHVASPFRTYVPYVDYTLNGKFIVFSVLVDLVNVAIVTITQQAYYKYSESIVGQTGSRFGSSIDISDDGRQIAIGAPYATVNSVLRAGTAVVYSRAVEAHISTGSQTFTATNKLGPAYRVIINDEEITEFNINGEYSVDLHSVPPVGTIVYLETGVHILQETLVSNEIQDNAYFGTSVAVAPDSSSVYVGAPYYDHKGVYNSGAVISYNNVCQLYGEITGTEQNPTIPQGNSFFIDYVEIVTSGVSLQSLINDINNANISGVTASNVDGYLYISTNTKLTKNLLSLTPGYTDASTPSVLDAAGLTGYVLTQVVVNPYSTAGEYFGSRIAIDSTTDVLVISSDRGTTKAYTTFDTNLTTFDGDTTGFFADILGSGAVYTFDLYNDPRNNIFNPGVYAFGQQLNPGGLVSNDQFGHAIDVSHNFIIASAPHDDTYLVIDINSNISVSSGDTISQVSNTDALFTVAFDTELSPRIVVLDNAGNALNTANVLIINDSVTDVIPTATEKDTGSVYIFENKTNKGWDLLREEQNTVDIDSVNQMYLYSTLTNTVLSQLEFIDPIKGKILGQAEQEISYKTDYDPAEYNKGTNVAVNLNNNLYWGAEHVDKVWWNLSLARFIDYEQDTLSYRSLNWGRLFPGSVIEILEWVESDTLPSNYAGDGVPKYADDSAYVELPFVNPTTGVISSKYYYWVKDKTSITGINPSRKLPIAIVADMIANPKAQGIPYAAVTSNSSVIAYNIASDLSSTNTVLHINHQEIKNTNIIHSEYDLIEKGNSVSVLPAKIVTKLIDSLTGTDKGGNPVPDPTLSPASQLGIGFRPCQSMFINRFGALAEMVSYVNSVLIKTPVVKQHDLTLMLAEEPKPSFKAGEYDLNVASYTELTYIDTHTLSAGYTVLVDNDSTNNNLWTVYELQADKTWLLTRVQSYKTSRYWSYVDWYADGYSSATLATYVAPTSIDALKLSYAPGDVIEILNTGNGEWELVLVDESGEFDVIGIQNGTLALSTVIGVNSTENPVTEVRNIVTALQQDIFTGELSAEFNKMFFVIVNYIFVEQKYVDWIFKTSFVSVFHQLRTLDQVPSFVQDNQTYFKEYLDEVKPYKTKVREYVTSYTGVDNYEGGVTDFDLPPYYDTTANMFRSPSGENVVEDEKTWQQKPYSDWYNNRNFIISSVILEDVGSGYTSVPIITFVGGGEGAIPPEATAVIDFDRGTITRIDITKIGTGYTSRPEVVVNGTNTLLASAYAVLTNNQVRSFDTTLKFDRITYNSLVTNWTANTNIVVGDIVSYQGVGFTPITDINTGPSFLSTDYTIVPASSFSNANDRIMAYYSPSETMPAKDLGQLLPGINYPGVKVQGATFDQQPGFDMPAFDTTVFDALEYDEDGNPVLSGKAIDQIISSSYTDAALGTRPEDILIEGGKYVDIYSSHAPEELVPGMMFDTLDMKVYTRINDFDVLGYRIFNNMLRSTTFLRIADAYSSILTADLHYNDTVIRVADASKLMVPDPTRTVPGVIFVNNERITYYTLDTVTNTLGQIRRGTEGTGVPAVHPAGTAVTDASIQQIVPESNSFVSTTLEFDTTYDIILPPRYIFLTERINANVGDVISQTISGNSATVIGANVTSVDRVQVRYDWENPEASFYYSPILVTMSGAVPDTLVPGDFVTQESTGANLVVLTQPEVGSTNVEMSYLEAILLDFGLGNVSINGISTSIYPENKVYTAPIEYGLYINGVAAGNVFPLAAEVSGELSEFGNITLLADSVVVTSTNWYNPGVGEATDGTGFEGAVTPEVLFLKESVASYDIGILSEDSINIIGGEDGSIVVDEEYI